MNNESRKININVGIMSQCVWTKSFHAAEEIVWCLISQTQLEIYDHITTEYEYVNFLYKNAYLKSKEIYMQQ